MPDLISCTAPLAPVAAPFRPPSPSRCPLDQRFQDVARTFHEFLPGSELFLIPGARHFVEMDEPEQVARLILAMPKEGSKKS